MFIYVQVFQRRVDGSVDFHRGWDDYVQLFGDIRHEHWLGKKTLTFIFSTLVILVIETLYCNVFPRSILFD